MKIYLILLTHSIFSISCGDNSSGNTKTSNGDTVMPASSPASSGTSSSDTMSYERMKSNAVPDSTTQK